jgi:hypothetical protein
MTGVHFRVIWHRARTVSTINDGAFDLNGGA